MKIQIKDIHSGGIEVEGTLASKVVGERGDDHLKFIEALNIKTQVEKVENTVIVNTDVTGKYSAVCSRCLEEVKSSWHRKFTLDFEIERNTVFIELDEDLRQEVILGLPLRILCDDNCQGICPDCGVNLNKEQCKNK